MASFNVLALDDNFQIVDIVAYISLQWSRKWHECGNFSMQVPLNQYKNTWKYIYTKDRPEVGEITQINYFNQNGSKVIMVSGYFLEKELDRMVVYPQNTTSDDRESIWYFDSPSMSNIAPLSDDFLHVESTADVVARKYFERFKKISFYNYTGYDQAELKTFELDIYSGNSEAGAYKWSDHYRNGEQLGWKIYDILKPSGASYRVRLDYDSRQKYFDILSGKDRTEDSGNNPIVFSTKYGNVINPSVVIDNGDYLDGLITSTEYQIKYANIDLTKTRTSVNAKVIGNAVGKFTFYNNNVNVSDYKFSDEPDTMTFELDGLYDTFNYKKDVANDMLSELQGKNVSLINLEFETTASSYEYMKDFDIGYLVSLEIPEIGISADVRLIGCYEVMQEGKWTLNMEFGTPIIK